MPTTPKKKAYRRVVRRANGIGLRVAYFDAETGQELTSLDGYELIDQGFLPPNTGTGNGDGDNDDDDDDDNHSGGGGGGGDNENSTSGVNMPYYNPHSGRQTGRPGSSVLKSLPIAGDMASAKGKQDQSNLVEILRNTLGPGGKLIMDTVFGTGQNTNPVTGQPSTQPKKAPINTIIDTIFGTGEQLPPIEDRPPPISTSKFPPKNDNDSATFTDKIGGGSSGALGNPNPPPQDIGIPSTPKITTGEIAKGVFYNPDDIATRKYPPAPQLAADLGAVRQGLEIEGYDVYFVINSGGQTPVGGKVAGGGTQTEVFGPRRTASGTENHDIKQAGTTLAVDFKVYDSAGNELTEEEYPEIWQSMSKYATIAGFTQIGVGTSEIGNTITHFGKDPQDAGGAGSRTWAYLSGATVSKENLPQSVKDGIDEGLSYMRDFPDSNLYQTLLHYAGSSISGAPIPYQRGDTQKPVPDEQIMDMGSGTWTDRVRDPVAALPNSISSRSTNNLAVDPKLQEVMKNFSDVGSMPSFNEMNTQFNSQSGSGSTRTGGTTRIEQDTGTVKRHDLGGELDSPYSPGSKPSPLAYPSEPMTNNISTRSVGGTGPTSMSSTVKPNPNEAVGDMADELRRSQGSSTFTDRIGNSSAVTSSSGSVDDIPWPGQEDQTLSALPYADAAEQFRQERAGSGTFTDRINDPIQRLTVDPNPASNRPTGLDMAQQLRLSQQEGSGTFTDRIFIPPPSPVTGEPQPPVVNGVPIEDGKEIPVNMNELMGSEESGIDAYRTPTGIPSSSGELAINKVNTVPINPTTGMPYPGSSTFSDRIASPAPAEATGFIAPPLTNDTTLNNSWENIFSNPKPSETPAPLANSISTRSTGGAGPTSMGSTAEPKGFIPPPEQQQQQGSATFTDKIGGQAIPDPYNLNDPERERTVVYTLLGEEYPDNEEGMAGVAWTMLNRANAGTVPGVGVYPNDPVAVALQPGQYSTWNDVTGYNGGKDGNQKRVQKDFPPDSPEYQSALKVARMVFAGMSPDPTFGSTHYHTPAVSPPWASDPRINKYGAQQVGNHLYYPQQDPARIVGSQVTSMVPWMGDMSNASVPLPRTDPRRDSTVTNMSDTGSMPSYSDVTSGFMSPASRSSSVGSMPSYNEVSGFMSSPESSTYVNQGSSTFTDKISSPTSKGYVSEDKSTYVNEPSGGTIGTPKSGTSTTSKGTSSEPEKSTYVESSGFMNGPSSPASSTTSKGSTSSSHTKNNTSSSGSVKNTASSSSNNTTSKGSTSTPKATSSANTHVSGQDYAYDTYY